MFWNNPDVKAAWAKCNRLWREAGGTYPCFERKYMAARDELAAAIERAKASREK